MPRARQRCKRPKGAGEAVLGDEARAQTFHESSGRLAAAGHKLPPLPPGWTDATGNRGSERPSFVHQQGTTSMDPRFMPANWEMRLDDACTPYFHSHEFQLSTYVDPRGLPPGWRLCVASEAESRACFVSDDGHFTTCVDPRGLPDHWELRSFESMVRLPTAP